MCGMCRTISGFIPLFFANRLCPTSGITFSGTCSELPNTHTYRYVTLVVDGTPYTIDQTYSAIHNGWADNLGVQYQLDVNSTGTGYHEWIDQSTFTVW